MIRTKITLVFLLSIFGLLPTLSAQENFRFSSTFIAYENIDINKITSVRSTFDSIMKSNGAIEDYRNHTLFLLNLSAPFNGNQYALSITSLTPLPEHVIQSGKLGQVFYSNLVDDKIPLLTQEATEVREYLSEEYIRQYYSIANNWIIIGSSDSLEMHIKELISQKILPNF